VAKKMKRVKTGKLTRRRETQPTKREKNEKAASTKKKKEGRGDKKEIPT